MSVDPVQIADALAVSRRLGTVRLRASTQPYDPVPSVRELRLEGTADLRSRITLVKERMLSPDAADRIRGRAAFGTALSGMLAAVGEGETEMLYAGGARYFRDSDGGWTRAYGAGRHDGVRHPEDPLWLLDVLAATTPRVDERSRELLDTVPTMRIGGRIDLAAAPQPLQPQMSRLERAADLLRRCRTARWMRAMPFVVWIDDGSRLCRIAYATVPAPEGSPIWWTTDLWDYGCSLELPSVPEP